MASQTPFFLFGLLQSQTLKARSREKEIAMGAFLPRAHASLMLAQVLSLLKSPVKPTTHLAGNCPVLR